MADLKSDQFDNPPIFHKFLNDVYVYTPQPEPILSLNQAKYALMKPTNTLFYLSSALE